MLKSIQISKEPKELKPLLQNLGFTKQCQGLMIVDGTLFEKTVLTKGSQFMTVSREIGTVKSLDPVISIIGESSIIDKIEEMVKNANL